MNKNNFKTFLLIICNLILMLIIIIICVLQIDSIKNRLDKIEAKVSCECSPCECKECNCTMEKPYPGYATVIP